MHTRRYTYLALKQLQPRVLHDARNIYLMLHRWVEQRAENLQKMFMHSVRNTYIKAAGQKTCIKGPFSQRAQIYSKQTLCFMKWTCEQARSCASGSWYAPQG